MKLFRLNEKQETLLAEKIFDLANYFIVGLVITQFAGERIDWIRVSAGCVLYLILAIIATRLRR